MKIRTEKVIAASDWDSLVEKTYGRKYILQQQEGCMERRRIHITIPDMDNVNDDYMNDEIPEIINHDIMGVKFSKWLERDPKQNLKDEAKGERVDQWGIDLWWERNFYPDLQTVANDLHLKGLIEAGNYTIDIDW
jgi:hypothetical protein